MTITTTSVAVTTTGSAGSATGSGTITPPEAGYIEWIHLDFNASAPATTDTTITHANTPPGGNILVATNTATDALHYPRAGAVDSAASAITDSATRVPATGPISVSVAGADALDPCVTVTVAISDR